MGGRYALFVVVAISLVTGCGGSEGSARNAEPGKAVHAEAINGFIGGAPEIDTGGLFSEPSDVAVYTRDAERRDTSIFVVEADAGRSSRVQRLDRNGNFELAWGRDVVRQGAHDDGTGAEICRRAASCKAAPPGGAAGEFRQATAIAVNDPTGDVYVADTGNLRIQRFTDDGRFVSAWGWGVATGEARYEVCAAACRPGRHGKAEGNANPGQFAPVKASGIAIKPIQGDVFVADGGNNRIMQFTPNGDFVRAWGVGVAEGRDRLETCETRCRAARARTRNWVTLPEWPQQIAIDADGIVYATDHQAGSRLLRFDTDDASDGGAHDALLPPLPSGHQVSGDDNMGVEVDPVSGRLVAVWNQFGPAVVDTISEPGAIDGLPWSKRRKSVALGFIRSAYSFAIDPATGVIYLAKSHNLHHLDPSTSFDSCPTAGRRSRACHGLIVISTDGDPRVTVAKPSRTGRESAQLVGSVTATGA